MKAPAFDYVAPASVDEAMRCLAEGENARVLAGGQSLVAMLNMRFAFPELLVDINRIPALSYIREAGPVIEFGAMTRQRDIEFSDIVGKRLPILREAVLNVGHRQTRNRGTVGGSLCQLDPSAEIPTIATLLDATLAVGSARGLRSLRMQDFPAGYMTPALDADEMLLGVSLPVWEPSHGHAFIEFARRHGDFAIVSVAVMLQFGGDGLITRAAIALGGVSSAPVRMTRAEDALLQTRGTASDIDDASRLCGEVDATTDTYTPGWYRQHLARVLSRRAIATAIARAQK